MINRINSGRQNELDIAKGLAVLFMVLVHFLLQFSSYATQEESVYGQIVQFLGGVPAAPVFMFMLGVGIIYSRRNTPSILIKRGATLIILGYLLNILRSVIPESINLLNGYSSYTTLEEIFYDNFFYVDILQFAGLALIFFSFVLAKDCSNKFLTAMGLFFMLSNYVLLPYSRYFVTPASAPIVNLFVGGSEASYFPFLTWIIYPILGYLFGSYLIQTNNKVHFYKKILIYSTGFLVIYILGIFNLNFPTGYESDAIYYHHTFPITLFYGLFVLWWVSVLFFVSRKFTVLSYQHLINASKYTTEIYFAHFVLMGILSIFLHSKLGTYATILASLLLYIMSYYLSMYYKNFQGKQKLERVKE